MPVYIYECDSCGLRVERRQLMLEQPLVDCPGAGGTYSGSSSRSVLSFGDPAFT